MSKETELKQKELSQTDKLIKAVEKLEKGLSVNSKEVKKNNFTWKSGLKGVLSSGKESLSDKFSLKGISGMLGVKPGGILGGLIDARHEDKKETKANKEMASAEAIKQSKIEAEEAHHYASVYRDTNLEKVRNAGTYKEGDEEKFLKQGVSEFQEHKIQTKIVKELEEKESKAQKTGIGGAGLFGDDKNRLEHAKSEISRRAAGITKPAPMSVDDRIDQATAKKSAEVGRPLTDKEADSISEEILKTEQAQLKILEQMVGLSKSTNVKESKILKTEQAQLEAQQQAAGISKSNEVQEDRTKLTGKEAELETKRNSGITVKGKAEKIGKVTKEGGMLGGFFDGVKDFIGGLDIFSSVTKGLGLVAPLLTSVVLPLGAVVAAAVGAFKLAQAFGASELGSKIGLKVADWTDAGGGTAVDKISTIVSNSRLGKTSKEDKEFAESHEEELEKVLSSSPNTREAWKASKGGTVAAPLKPAASVSKQAVSSTEVNAVELEKSKETTERLEREKAVASTKQATAPVVVNNNSTTNNTKTNQISPPVRSPETTINNRLSSSYGF